MRQRVRFHGSPVRIIGQLLVLVFACALVWYGLMTALVAAKIISPDTANGLSGYRSAYDYLAGLQPSDIDSTARLIIAGAGLLAFLLFGWLAYQELPRPRLARTDLELHHDDHGSTAIEPRAIERIAETAAQEHSAVTDANSRFGTENLHVGIDVRRAREVATTLTDVQERVRQALDRHGLPPLPIDVTLTGFARKQRRELQ